MSDMEGRRTGAGGTLLAVVRIAIGWHFLYEGLWKLMQEKGWSCASYLDAAQGPLAGLFKWMSSQGWLVAIGDYAVMIGLTLIGISLITGVLARVASIFGIALMAMFYCCQPPEPFAEAFSGADGRFFILERNAIESIGLLLIAVTPCWRGFVRTLLPGILVLVVFGGAFWHQCRIGAFKHVEAVTSATVKVHKFVALDALKKPFTDRTTVGGVEISRLALGGDLISGRSHARDLIWTDEFMRRYNSGATLERTIHYCLKCGIDTVFAEANLRSSLFEQARKSGGRLKFFANCASAQEARAAADGGARSVYLRPELADELAKKGDAEGLKAIFAAFKATALSVGVGAEDVATVKFCVANGVVPDYWVLAYHSLNYAAATMKPRCNNIWCEDPVAAAAYMKTRKEPWVAIRVLAGGALQPVDAYHFARDGGASAVAIDLLDYRIVETVNDATLTRDEYQKKKQAPKGKTPPGPSSPAAKGAKGKEKTK